MVEVRPGYFRTSWPMAAAAVIFDEEERVLLVQPAQNREVHKQHDPERLHSRHSSLEHPRVPAAHDSMDAAVPAAMP